MQTIQVKTQSHSLDLLVFTPEDASKNPMPVLLIARGWPSKAKEDWAETAQRISNNTGYVTAIYDYAGTFSNQEIAANKATINHHVTEITSVYDALSALEICDERQISIYGSSYGAHISTMMTSLRQVKGLRLSAPAFYLKNVADRPIHEFMSDDSLMRRDDLQNSPAIAALNSYTGELMIIEHGSDELIPKTIINLVVKNSSKCKHLNYKIIASADHRLSMPAWKSETEQITNDWMKQIKD